MTQNKTKLLTTSMAAKLLGFTPNYVRRLISKGKIKAQKLGFDWFMTEKDLSKVTRQRARRTKPK